MALTIGKLTRTKTAASGGSVDLEDVPALTAIADIVATLPANGVIGALTFSNPPTQAECQALRDKTEDVRDVVADLVTKVNALLARARVTGGHGLIAD